MRFLRSRPRPEQAGRPSRPGAAWNRRLWKMNVEHPLRVRFPLTPSQFTEAGARVACLMCGVGSIQWTLALWLPTIVEAFPMAMNRVETGHFRGTRSPNDPRSSTQGSHEQQGKEIQLDEVRRGDVKQSGAFGGQNFSIFSFKGSQMALYMFSPFSIYFADEAQDNEVENEGDDASSKNQYLSQSKYGQQRGAGPTFLYQPNFDNRRRLNLIKRLLKRQKGKKDSGEASPIPLSITDSTPGIVEGPSTKDIFAKLLKASSTSKRTKHATYSAEHSGESGEHAGGYLSPGFPAVPVPFQGGGLPLPGPQLAPGFGSLYG